MNSKKLFRARHLSEARIFDLPKAAPTARIIKLSTLLRKGKRSGGDDDLLRDAAGPFDNFDAFDLDTLEPSSAEAKPSRKHHKTDRKSKGERTEDIGNFFPENR
ncbi:unnamed protein product [Cylicostephanus goldi]|uniref:Uncharacterized protein n=1 Tax=Cylicostephanus goldi TaxID=71465 RepID=A0A3P7M129_CYLGO|nr:unnamed protein product [Cylicostephanus goldi]